MLNYIIDSNGELSSVTDSLYNFLLIYDSIEGHEYEIRCNNDGNSCIFYIDKEYVLATDCCSAIVELGEVISRRLYIERKTGDRLVSDTIIAWKDKKECIRIGKLKY